MISQEMKQVVELFTQGRKLYNEMKFDEAKKYFLKALSIRPEDGPSKEYLKRCEIYISDPPPADWDGVFVMKTK